MELLNNRTSRAEINNQVKLRWCLLNNSVYDLSEFLHPGGEYIIEQCNGREVGRFLFGAYCLENLNMDPYKHSIYAINYLEKNFVGEIDVGKINILQL